MGRGSAGQRELAEQQLRMQNDWINGQRAEREQGRSMLMPQAQELMNSEGYSGEEKGAMTGAAMESGDAAFDAGQQRMNNRVATTHNSAGFFGNTAKLAQGRAQQKSDTARQLTQSFADEKQRRRTQGRQLLSSMYGMDTNLLGSIAGLPNQALNNRAAGISQGSGLFGGSGFLGLF